MCIQGTTGNHSTPHSPAARSSRQAWRSILCTSLSRLRGSGLHISWRGRDHQSTRCIFCGRICGSRAGYGSRGRKEGMPTCCTRWHRRTSTTSAPPAETFLLRVAAHVKLKARFESGLSYLSFKRYNQARTPQGQPGVNLRALPSQHALHSTLLQAMQLAPVVASVSVWQCPHCHRSKHPVASKAKGRLGSRSCRTYPSRQAKKWCVDERLALAPPGPSAKALHSYTVRLDVSTFCVMDLVISVAKTAQVTLRSGQVLK